MKDDERAFLLAFYKSDWPHGTKLNPLRQAVAMGIPEKRARYLLGKWWGLEWVEVGTCLDWAWLTDAGKAKAREVMS